MQAERQTEKNVTQRGKTHVLLLIRLLGLARGRGAGGAGFTSLLFNGSSPAASCFFAAKTNTMKTHDLQHKADCLAESDCDCREV